MREDGGVLAEEVEVRPSRRRWIIRVLAAAFIATPVIGIVGKGLDNKCKNYALNQSEQHVSRGAWGWETHRSVSIWPPGLACRLTFEDETQTTYVAPWGPR